MADLITIAAVVAFIIAIGWYCIYVFPYKEKDKWAVPNVSV